MSNIYEQTLLVGSEHVDCNRRLRTSTLFALMQTAAIRHTEALGMGRDKTLDKGLLWVVARQYVAISRWPMYDEEVTLRSWPGDTMRVLFPRYCELRVNGETLVCASTVWTLMDSASRTVAFPDEYGIEIPGVEIGTELPYLNKLTPLDTPESFEFTVPYSYVDLNGHMNNTRYFDVAEDRIPAIADQSPRIIQTEYMAEAKRGETLHVQWGREGGRVYCVGAGEHPCFRMSLEYLP